MTLEDLQRALEHIPPTGPINKARRAAIQRQIYALMEAQANVDSGQSEPAA